MPFFNVEMENGDIMICHFAKDSKRKYVQFNETASESEIKATFGRIVSVEGIYRNMPVMAPTSRIIAMRGVLGSTIFPAEGTIWPDEAPTL